MNLVRILSGISYELNIPESQQQIYTSYEI